MLSVQLGAVHNKGDLQGELKMIYGLFTKLESPDIRLNGSEKNSPHLYPKIQGFEGVF